jgi:hypothetical protein
LKLIEIDGILACAGSIEKIKSMIILVIGQNSGI